jgi:hypothetical protein
MADPALISAAEAAAQKLELEFEHVPVGYGELETGLRNVAMRQNIG